jgi:hypothetical protein
MVGRKTAGALALAAAALVAGIGAAAAAEDNRDLGTDGTRVTSEHADATKPPTLVARPGGKDQ